MTSINYLPVPVADADTDADAWCEKTWSAHHKQRVQCSGQQKTKMSADQLQININKNYCCLFWKYVCMAATLTFNFIKISLFCQLDIFS